MCSRMMGRTHAPLNVFNTVSVASSENVLLTKLKQVHVYISKYTPVILIIKMYKEVELPHRSALLISMVITAAHPCVTVTLPKGIEAMCLVILIVYYLSQLIFK